MDWKTTKESCMIYGLGYDILPSEQGVICVDYVTELQQNG